MTNREVELYMTCSKLIDEIKSLIIDIGNDPNMHKEDINYILIDSISFYENKLNKI